MQKKLENLIADFNAISYVGSFDASVLAAFAKRLEKAPEENSTLNKKIFKIFVELGQNIAQYSSDKIRTKRETTFKGNGIIIIKEYKNKFTLYTGNFSSPENANIAHDKCEKINSLEYDELRNYKRELRRKPSPNGGGNIGLVQVVLIAKNKLNCQIKKITPENYFIMFSIDINK